ncbi:hypothetical protein SteCoe_35670 [Stentor coeruleus]|uniref:Palmitoyltransferase n=1 Tax=Stentor coeruleus TaxID=5963 RepID=A0A1R2ART1_9CILI|nr:hypothetical protein SteCoe_35670 [Stentor coeruleus]
MEIESSKAYRKTFGNLKCFIFIKHKPLICIGPHWPFFLCFFTGLVLLSIFFIFNVCPRIGIISTILGVVNFGFLLTSYFLAAIVNPGIEMNQLKDDDLECDSEITDNFCIICQVYRHPRSEHCEECGVCIQEYDHHCPWTSKCIGKGNIKYFYCFLTGLFISFVFGIIIMAIQSKIKNS